MAIPLAYFANRALVVSLAGALASMAQAQSGVPVVTLTSSAFEAPPVAGELLRFAANVSGGLAPLSGIWMAMAR